MRSPLFIFMSATAIVLVGVLCLLSYEGYENPRKEIEQKHDQKPPVTSPEETYDESQPLPHEMTFRFEGFPQSKPKKSIPEKSTGGPSKTTPAHDMNV